MKNSIKTELVNHILDKINDGILTNENKDDWHFYCFNEDYYIVYHSEAIKWLLIHNLDTFEAIDIVKDYENENFGKFTTNVNPESIVNMLAYIYGEEIIYNCEAETIENLKIELTNLLN